MLDDKGYRYNVGIIIINQNKKVFWAKRTCEEAWQFPQGGIKKGESPDNAMLRELYEETGLKPNHIQLIGKTNNWLYYDVPNYLIKNNWKGKYKGQRQIWFLLNFVGNEEDIILNRKENPEFDAWRWLDYHEAPSLVINFKKKIYCNALTELSNYIFFGEELEEIKLKLSR